MLEIGRRRYRAWLPIAAMVAVSACGESDPTEPMAMRQAPAILSIQFPDTAPTAAGSESEGTVFYTDGDGDVVLAIFEEISDPNDAIEGDFEISITQTNAGQDNFIFVFECPLSGGGPCAAGPVTLGVTLQDLVGQRSARAQFSFTFAP